jgi:hypothetical protein
MRIFFLLISALFFFNNCMSQPFISKKQAIEDIDFYNSTLQDVHYNPYLFISRKEYEAAVDKVKAGIGDSISLQQFIRQLYGLTSLLKDSHTSPYIVQSALRNDLKSEIFFPFKVVTHQQRLYIPTTTATQTGLPAGAEIVSINKKDVRPLIDSFRRYIGGIKAFSAAMADKLLGYFFYLSDIKAPFTITYKKTDGTTGEKQVDKGISFIEGLKMNMPALTTPHEFRVIDNRLGCINFMSMSETIGDFDHFLDSCFTYLKKNNIQNVAIDLRNNSGGNSILGDLLLSYFHTGEYQLMGGKKWKVSAQYQQHLRQNGDTTHEYLKKAAGSIWELGNCKPGKNMFVNDNVFAGNVYFITGPFTFSSANMLADGAKHFTRAQLVGEPTGENTNDFGETYLFELPNSKIKMQVTTSFDSGVECNSDLNEPVTPHHLIEPTLDDKIQGRDKALAFILSKIE